MPKRHIRRQPHQSFGNPPEGRDTALSNIGNLVGGYQGYYFKTLQTRPATRSSAKPSNSSVRLMLNQGPCAVSERIERAQVRYTQDIELPDINSREEIIGIRLGRDIEHVLPSEMALLADPETSILFDLKYVESRLMCFDMQLRQQIEQQRTHGNRFYSLVVGDCFMTQRLTSLFDHEWVYDPHSSQIHELIGFQRKLEGVLET